MAKLTVEEYDVDGKARAYNLRRIEMPKLSRAQYSQLLSENRGKYAYNSDALSVAQLFDFVKQYDKDFKPKPVHESMIEDGKPKILYHQTENDFTEFDTSREGAGTRDNETPFGVFLKQTERDIGLRGKKQMPLYARMENPLVVNDRAELVKRISELSPSYAEFYAKSKEIDRKYSEKAKNAEKAFNDFVRKNAESPNRKSRQELYADEEFNRLFDAEDIVVEEWQEQSCENDRKAKEAITKALKDNGFDGVVLKVDEGSHGRSTEAYIVLDAEQVKSVAYSEDLSGEVDNIGTFDRGQKDIRYSRGEEYDPYKPYVHPAYATMPEYSAPLEVKYEYQGDGYTATNGLKLFSKYSVDAALSISFLEIIRIYKSNINK